MRLPYKIYSYKQYWATKIFLRRAKFGFYRQKYKLKNFVSAEKYKVKSGATHIRLTLSRILKAVLIISLLFWIEDLATNYWISNYQKFPKWLIELQKILPKPTYPDDKEAVIELLSIISSVTGVILALFYPILATIASTAYAKVHASIRNLLLYEKETQAYLKRLTYLTASSIIVLLFTSFHFRPGNLVLSFLAFSSFTTLFGILKIGLGVYNFFEPSTLGGIVFKKLTDNIKNVTTKGEYWHEQNFQKHNYKLAVEQTENLSLLMRLCLKDNELKESSFKSIFQTSLFSLQYYLKQKPIIPIESLWFPNTSLHLSYFESDMTKRDLAKNTNTFIQPQIKQDFYWFEERIINIIGAGFEGVVRGGHIQVFGEAIAMTHPVLNSLSTVTDIRAAEILLKKIHSNLLLITKDKIKESDILKYEDLKNELGCIETYCYAILRFQAGVFDTLSHFDSNKIKLEYGKINWKDKKSIYSTEFIPELYDRLNLFFKYVENETIVEGRQVTPDWYFRQSLTSYFLILMKEKIASSIVLFRSFLLSLSNHFENKNNYLLSTFTSQIGLEIIHKINYRINILKETINDLDKLEVCKGEFTWTNSNFEEIEVTLVNYENKCYEIISKNIEKLSLIKWNNQFPDVFAQSYSIVSNQLNSYFETNNHTDFQKYFPPFLKAAIKAFENLNQTYKHFDKPQNVSYQALLDLMEISGYSYIYSVIFEKPEFWSCTKSTWDDNFLPTSDNIKLFATFYKYYSDSLNGTGLNYIEKHHREMTLTNVTQKLGIKKKDIDDWLVKQFIQDSHYSNFYDVSELFLELYLFSFINAKEATALSRRDLFKQWSWIIENPKEKNNDD